MNKITMYYATFYTPGVFVADTWHKNLDSTDPTMVEWPDDAYCFDVFKREDVVDGEATYKGKPEQVGKRYYHPDSKVEDLAQAKVNPNSTDTLISNMEINKFKYIVWSRWGNWPQPFDYDKDEVLK